MKVWVVMACTHYDGDTVDSVWLNKCDAEEREAEIDNGVGVHGHVDYGQTVEMEVHG